MHIRHTSPAEGRLTLRFPFVSCPYRYRQWEQKSKHLSPRPEDFSCIFVHKQVQISSSLHLPAHTCLFFLIKFLLNETSFFFFFCILPHLVLPTQNIFLQKQIISPRPFLALRHPPPWFKCFHIFGSKAPLSHYSKVFSSSLYNS